MRDDRQVLIIRNCLSHFRTDSSVNTLQMNDAQQAEYIYDQLRSYGFLFHGKVG